MIAAIATLSAAVVYLAAVVYDLKARVIDLEKQSDADLQLAAWEARFQRADDRLLETAVLCEARHVEAEWQSREGKALLERIDKSQTQGSAKP